MLVLAYVAAQSRCKGGEGTCGTKSIMLLQIRQERAREAVVLSDSSQDAEEEDQESFVGAEYELAECGQGCPTNTMVKDENKCKKAAEALQLKWNPEKVNLKKRPGGCFATKGKTAYFNSIFEDGKKIWKKAQGICFVAGPDVGPSPAPPQQSTLTCPSEIRCCSHIHQQIKKTENVVYGEAPDLQGKPETLLLDIYEPKQKLNKLPAVVYIHGGSFKPSSKKSTKTDRKICENWAKRDFLCVSIEYRRWGPPGNVEFGRMVRAAAEDALTAVRYLVKHSEARGIDVHNIGMMGNSAGGFATSCVSFAVSMAGGIARKWKKKWAPASIKDAGIPPYLGIHYTGDPTVDYDNAEYAQELLNDLKISNVLRTLQGKGHTPDLNGQGKFNEKLFDDVVGFALRHMNIPDCQLA